MTTRTYNALTEAEQELFAAAGFRVWETIRDTARAAIMITPEQWECFCAHLCSHGLAPFGLEAATDSFVHLGVRVYVR